MKNKDIKIQLMGMTMILISIFSLIYATNTSEILGIVFFIAGVLISILGFVMRDDENKS